MTLLDASHEGKVKKREQKAKMAYEQLVEDWRSIMKTPEGRRAIWWLLGEHGVMAGGFNSDVNRMVFDAGQRNQGLKLMAFLVEHMADLFALMQSEDLRKQKKEEAYE